MGWFHKLRNRADKTVEESVPMKEIDWCTRINWSADQYLLSICAILPWSQHSDDHYLTLET